MGAPPGGPEDRIPPQVVATEPDTFATVDGIYREAVVFRFNERISERPTQGELSEAVIVSPRTGDVQVEHNRESLEVSLIGGFREGIVYRLTLRPVIRDMFQNTMLDSFELVFSTGAPIEPYVLAGTVADRITGDPVTGARVNAVLRDPGPDTLMHTAVTDTGGVYAMRYIPPGTYRVTAFEDRDRDLEVDAFEPQGQQVVAVDPPSDTAVIALQVLEPDTTPAQVVSVEVVDSTALLVETDDYLDPGSGYLASVSVALEPGEEAEPGVPEPGVDSLLHAGEWERRMAVIDSIRQARADSVARLRADSLETVADSLLAAGDSAAADSVRTLALRAAPEEEGGAPAGREAGAPPEGPEEARAEQAFYALLDRPLPVNVPYRVTVEGIENINGVSGGGGEASVTRLPPPDTAAADTAGAEPDTAGVEPDTAGVRPDPARTPPDTSGAAPARLPGDRDSPDPLEAAERPWRSQTRATWSREVPGG